MTFKIKKHILKFKKPAGTSRGVLLEKPSWFLSCRSNLGIARGEVSIIPDLSIDTENVIESKLQSLANYSIPEIEQAIDHLDSYPAIQFGLEMLLKDYNAGGRQILFENSFPGGQGIPINGLVWMGNFDDMYNQVRQKIEAGYKCIKIKIAAIDWDEELSLLKYIRSHFSVSDIQIRVDANGGFSMSEALDKLKQLSELEVHSIEQPIRQGQWQEMAELCSRSPLPIALDEELIGIFKPQEKRNLLQTIKPAFVILKPSLLGGFTRSEEWISIAEESGIDFWVTSALESNIGLNAIAQWTAGLKNNHYQGLGTGQLYTNNIPSPLFIENGFIYYGRNGWDFNIIHN